MYNYIYIYIHLHVNTELFSNFDVIPRAPAVSWDRAPKRAQVRGRPGGARAAEAPEPELWAQAAEAGPRSEDLPGPMRGALESVNMEDGYVCIYKYIYTYIYIYIDR